MNYKMHLTPEEEEILNGGKGETMAKVMKTLVMYGDAFGATKMVPVTSKMGHLVTSFGLGVMQPVYDLMDQLIAGGALSSQKFSVDPKPLDPNVPSSFLKNIVFKKFMYNMQDSYDAQLAKLGLIDSKSYTCTCYMDEVGNTPKKGDVLSWAESSAVVYANSVLGARCNRNSGIIELFGSIVGRVPYFGLVTDEGRKATWIVEVKTTKKPEAQILGSAIGMKVMEDVPYVKGLDKWIGTELDGDDAVLHDGELAVVAHVRVGVCLRRRAMRCPARMAEADITVKVATVMRFGQQILNLAAGLGKLDRAAVEHGDAGRVIAAVFELLQPFEKDRRSLLRADVSNDSTHSQFSLLF